VDRAPSIGRAIALQIALPVRSPWCLSDLGDYAFGGGPFGVRALLRGAHALYRDGRGAAIDADAMSIPSRKRNEPARGPARSSIDAPRYFLSARM
jgi:hypothetical protein